MHKPTRRTFLAAASFAPLVRAAGAKKMPPDFTIILNSRQRLSFDALLGKVVVVEFLLTTCPHCQRCGRTMEKLYEEYGPQGFAVLGAAVDPDAQSNLLSFMIKSGARFPVGAAVDRELAYRLLDADLYDTSKLIYFPQLLFVDRKGYIRRHVGGTDDFFQEEEKNARAQIEEMLKGEPK